ncbi:MAG: pilus assembly protein [Actinobacteria bacterium]|nr:pilus assembly protein [Actinomycetota bacterium]MDQ3532372.1 pilus assembly protein [Actinomycetota bacterium]
MYSFIHRVPRADRERGQATLELALCLPLVAFVLAAVTETGLLVGDQMRLWHAAREAARSAVVDPDPDAARRAVAGAGLENAEVSVTPSGAARSAGEPLTVRLSLQPGGTTPLVGRLFSSIELHADATMRIELP